MAVTRAVAGAPTPGVPTPGVRIGPSAPPVAKGPRAVPGPPAAAGPTRRSSGRGTPRPAPILARQQRGPIVESVHRGHVVEVDAAGIVVATAGDPDTVVSLRSCVKPFTLIALVEAGGVREFGLAPAELAVMASSHSGEDLHVRTIQGVLRRAGISQTLLACGIERAPLDEITAARLARDGERPGPLRQNCSGMHAANLLLARLGGWTLDDYWRPEHPVQVACREAVARVFAVSPDALVTATDQCGVETYAFPLRAVARSYALLADPEGPAATAGRATLASSLRTIREAMVANPDLVGGTRERLDTSLMKALPGRLLVKGGSEGLRAIGVLPDRRASTAARAFAIKVEDGGGFDRASWSVAVETLRLARVVDGQALRVLGRYHRPVQLDPRGRVAAETVASFDLVPVGELLR